MSNRFVCNVSMGNACFEDNYSELAEILRKIADQVDGTSNTGKIIVDSSGAKVGQWEITPLDLVYSPGFIGFDCNRRSD